MVLAHSGSVFGDNLLSLQTEHTTMIKMPLTHSVSSKTYNAQGGTKSKARNNQEID